MSFVPRTAEALLLSLGLATAATGQARSSDPPPPTELAVRSRALGETRTAEVVLPRSYRGTRGVYPVLVVLDGESQGRLAAADAQFLADLSLIPELIVVSVQGGDRNIDYTPAAAPGFRPPQTEGTWGGADRFLEYLRDELLPAVAKTYRAAPFRILAGHSLGGLFVLHGLSHAPDVFQGYLAMDAAVWWNNRAVIAEARSVLARRDHPGIRFVAVESVNAIADDWASLEEAAGTGFVGRRIAIVGESHGSMPLKAFPDGLRALFPDYPAARPAAGVAALAQVLGQFDSLSTRLGYPLAPPAARLAAAAEASLAANRIDDADSAAILLERLYGRGATLRRAVATARTETADPDFIPLDFGPARPTPAAARSLLGTWKGEMTVPQGTSFEFTLTLAAAGDTVQLESEQRHPGRPPRPGGYVLVRLVDGGFEWGEPLRGLPGMIIYTARLSADGRVLEGTSGPPRGVKLPEQMKDAVRNRPPWTFRLERVPPP